MIPWAEEVSLRRSLNGGGASAEGEGKKRASGEGGLDLFTCGRAEEREQREGREGGREGGEIGLPSSAGRTASWLCVK